MPRRASAPPAKRRKIREEATPPAFFTFLRAWPAVCRRAPEDVATVIAEYLPLGHHVQPHPVAKIFVQSAIYRNYRTYMHGAWGVDENAQGAALKFLFERYGRKAREDLFSILWLGWVRATKENPQPFIDAAIATGFTTDKSNYRHWQNAKLGYGAPSVHEHMAWISKQNLLRAGPGPNQKALPSNAP